MSVYAIGDVQGCYSALRRLLDVIGFDPTDDRLWFTGDLVNRGEESLNVLRFVANLGESAVIVLGNHDLHLLAIANGVTSAHKGDTLDEILAAPDRDELLHWLRHRPLLHHDAALCCTLVHAGLLPQWDLELAQQCAKEAESVIRDARSVEFLKHMYGDEPSRWDPTLNGWGRLRLIVNAFTRLRFCTRDGAADYSGKGAPADSGSELIPWFEHPLRRTQQHRIVFGHWSALGLCHRDNIIAIDTGCVWGGELTAVRLDAALEFIGVGCSANT